MAGRIEQALQEAAAKRGFSIRVCGISPADQMRRGVRDRITGFYARRDPPRAGIYAPLPDYQVTGQRKWPTVAQVSDPAWVDDLMAGLLEVLDRKKVAQEAYRAQCLAEHAAKEELRNSPEEKEKSRARKEKWRNGSR